jgi:hypothetical protein
MNNVRREQLLVLLGRAPQRWPAPLNTWIEGGISTLSVETIYDAAALIAQARGSAILLVDPSITGRAELERLRNLIPHTALALMLPLTPDASAAAHDAQRYGLLSWEDGQERLAALSEGRSPLREGLLEEEEAALFSPNTADNKNYINMSIQPNGNSVTDDTPVRYDDVGVQPLLTEQEMRALLGAPD